MDEVKQLVEQLERERADLEKELAARREQRARVVEALRRRATDAEDAAARAGEALVRHTRDEAMLAERKEDAAQVVRRWRGRFVTWAQVTLLGTLLSVAIGLAPALIYNHATAVILVQGMSLGLALLLIPRRP